MRHAGFVASVIAALPFQVLGQRKQAGIVDDPDDSSAVGRGLVGSWRLVVTEANGSSSLGLATFGANGTVVTAEHPVVTPPGVPGVVFTSSGHGAWRATGPETAVFSFVGIGCDALGNLFGTVTIRVALALDSGAETFQGDFTATIADPAANVLATIPGTVTATRIVAEAPVPVAQARS